VNILPGRAVFVVGVEMQAPVKHMTVSLRCVSALVLAGWLFGVFAQAGVSVNKPVSSARIKGRIGPSNVPPSALSSGLYRSANPIDTTANLVVTGNVGGGRHFRGVVPYNAVTDFGGTVGSATLDSFLRRSAQRGFYGSGLTPFHSQTRTVTTLSPVGSRVVKAPVSRLGAAGGDAALPPLSSPYIKRLPPMADRAGLRKVHPTLSITQASVPVRDVRLRPMGMTAQELEQILGSREYRPGITPKPGEAGDERYRQQLERYRRDLRVVADKTTELKQRLEGAEDSLQPVFERKEKAQILKPFETKAPVKQTKQDKGGDIYEQMKADIEKLQQSIQAAQRQRDEKKAAEDEDKDKKAGAEKEAPKPELSQAERLTKAGLSAARARAILGEHKTFVSYSDDKFNRFLKAAEGYLKSGRYYRAADAYTLASIYKPDDPLAYAGKSHALFAAGEYMSSSLFLERALVIFPEYAWFKIDIEQMVGDRDTLENRIADIRQCLELSGAGELEFLLAYVYYQMGRADAAREAIDAAYEKMPEAQAVVTLKEAIDEFASKQTDEALRR